MMFYAKVQQSEAGIESDRLSMAGMFNALGQALRASRLTISLVVALQNQHQHRDQCSRGYLRMRYNPPTQPPHIQPARHFQRQLAKRFMKQAN